MCWMWLIYDICDHDRSAYWRNIVAIRYSVLPLRQGLLIYIIYQYINHISTMCQCADTGLKFYGVSWPSLILKEYCSLQWITIPLFPWKFCICTQFQVDNCHTLWQTYKQSVISLMTATYSSSYHTNLIFVDKPLVRFLLASSLQCLQKRIVLLTRRSH